MPSPCAEPSCPELATYRGRCATHAHTREQQINRAGHALYRTKRWQLLRRHVLFEQPLCPGINGQACGHLATDVHHIEDIAAGGEPWARANLAALCHSCHSRSTRQEQVSR